MRPVGSGWGSLGCGARRMPTVLTQNPPPKETGMEIDRLGERTMSKVDFGGEGGSRGGAVGIGRLPSSLSSWREVEVLSDCQFWVFRLAPSHVQRHVTEIFSPLFLSSLSQANTLTSCLTVNTRTGTHRHTHTLSSHRSPPLFLGPSQSLDMHISQRQAERMGEGSHHEMLESRLQAKHQMAERAEHR